MGGFSFGCNPPLDSQLSDFPDDEPLDTGDPGPLPDVSYELVSVTEVPGIRGQLDGIVPAIIQGEKGCLAVTSVQGDALNEWTAEVVFVTRNGVSSLWSLDLPEAGQRSYASGSSYTYQTDPNDPSTQTTVVAIPYSSTEGFPSGADGTHHGIFLFNDSGASLDLDLYAQFGVTRPGQLSFVDEDPLLGNQIGLRVLFGNGDTFTDDGTRYGTVEQYFPPSVVTIPVAILQNSALSVSEDFFDTPAQNFHSFVPLEGGLFLATAAGSAMGVYTGPAVDQYGALVTLDTDNRVVGSSVDIESGLGIGPSAISPNGDIYLSGWRLDGDSLLSLDQDGVEYYNLSGMAENTFVQGLLAFNDRVYVRVMEGGYIKTVWINPDDPSLTPEDYGNPIGAQWAHGFQLYDTWEGILHYCAGESATEIDQVDSRIRYSTISFHQANPE